MEPLQQWPDDASVLSQAANVIINAAKIEQIESFFLSMKRIVAVLLEVNAGIYIP